VMPAANHPLTGVSTCPFPVMGGVWAQARDLMFASRSGLGDTVVGSDVWLGHQALVLPGVRIGHGAIVGARSVVAADVPDYGVVAGDPARLIRRRFTDEQVDRLLRIAWWDWPVDLATRHLRVIMAGGVDELEAAAREAGLRSENPARKGLR
jgi:virginiamycin A acetyltransferase